VGKSVLEITFCSVSAHDDVCSNRAKMIRSYTWRFVYIYDTFSPSGTKKNIVMECKYVAKIRRKRLPCRGKKGGRHLLWICC